MKTTFLKTLFVTSLLSISFTNAVAGKLPSAKSTMEKAAQQFRENGGMSARFVITLFKGTQQNGSVEGTMSLQGNKYMMHSNTTDTWYNGETQWTYVKANEEVNITAPSAAEAQSLNPESYLSLYKKGYQLSIAESTLRGKKCYTVTMRAKKSSNKLQAVMLDIDQTTYQPYCIRLKQNNNWTRISIYDMKKKQNFTPTLFEFNHEKYPAAELIDLR